MTAELHKDIEDKTDEGKQYRQKGNDLRKLRTPPLGWIGLKTRTTGTGCTPSLVSGAGWLTGGGGAGAAKCGCTASEPGGTVGC